MPNGSSGKRRRPDGYERAAASGVFPANQPGRRFGVVAVAWLGVVLVLAYFAWGGPEDFSSHDPKLLEASRPTKLNRPGEKRAQTTGSALGAGWRSQRDAAEKRERVIGGVPAHPRVNDGPSSQNAERLVQVEVPDGSLSEVRADEVRRNLQDVAARGPDGTAAIEDLRVRMENGELDSAGSGFGDETSTTVSGNEVGSEADADPDGVGSLLKRLAGTTDPMEIAMLAQELEEQAPGVYRQEVLDAARQALQSAAKVPPEDRVDVSPVFETLEAYGGDGALKDLEQDTIWRQYSLMALAGMPDGQGVPSLLASASDPRIPIEQRPQLAFQMLAQAASEFPEAGEALLDLARSGQIPERAWRSVGSALEGMHLKFPLSIFDETDLAGDVGAAGGAPRVGGFENETLDVRYDLRLVSPTWSQEQLDRQIDLIDQLIDMTGSVDGRQALSEARAALLNARPPG